LKLRLNLIGMTMREISLEEAGLVSGGGWIKEFLDWAGRVAITYEIFDAYWKYMNQETPATAWQQLISSPMTSGGGAPGDGVVPGDPIGGGCSVPKLIIDGWDDGWSGW
jgi:hypothetical protein